MANNRVFEDIGKFIATQFDKLKIRVDKISNKVTLELDDFNIELSNQSKRQLSFYEDFTSKLQSSEKRFFDKSASVDAIISEVTKQTNRIDVNIKDNDIRLKAMTNRVTVTEGDIIKNTTDVTALEQTVLDVASETSVNLENVDIKLQKRISDVLTLLDNKIIDTNGRIEAIVHLSDSDKDSFVELVEYISQIDAENDNTLAAYIISNNLSVKNNKTKLDSTAVLLAALTTTVNLNKVQSTSSNAVLTNAVEKEKQRIDAILSASSADKDTFKEMVDFINSIDIENDANLATYIKNTNETLSAHQSMINNRYSKSQSDDRYLYKNANAISATKLETPRKIKLVGGLVGEEVFDGTNDITINSTVDATKHNHDTLYLKKDATSINSDKLGGLLPTQFSRSDTDSSINGVLEIKSNKPSLKFTANNTSSKNMILSSETNGLVVSTQLAPSTILYDLGIHGLDSLNGFKWSGQSLDDRYLGKLSTAVNSTKLGGVLPSGYVTTSSKQVLADTALSVSEDTITIHKADGSTESVSIHDNTLLDENVRDIVGAMVDSNTENGIIVTYDDETSKINFDVKDPILTLDGDISGQTVITNLGSATLTTTIKDNSHKHSIDNVTNLQIELNNRTTTSSKQVFASSSPVVNNGGQLEFNFADGSKKSISLSDSNSWRPIDDSLNSSDATISLSANQGKVLNEKKLDKTAKAVSSENSDKLNGLDSSQFVRSDTPDTRVNGTLHVSKNGISFPNDAFGGSGDTAKIFLDNPNGGEKQELIIQVTNDADDYVNIKTPTSTGLKHNGNTVWTSANDGSGSGLDADKLDGLNSSQFVRSDIETHKQSDLVFDSKNNNGTNSESFAITFNGSNDAGIDFGIRANGEVLEFFEPEDGGKVHLTIQDDTGVNALYGFQENGVKLTDKYLGKTAKAVSSSNTDKFNGQDPSFYKESFLNVYASNETNPAVGFNQDNGTLYFNYRGAQKSITNVVFRDGTSSGNKSNLDAKSITLQTESTINGHKIWHEGNDGSGSGLDADKLDGKDSSYFSKLNGDSNIDFNAKSFTENGSLLSTKYALKTELNSSAGKDIYMNAGKFIRFDSTVNTGSDYGLLTYDNDNDTYAKWGNSGENSALRMTVSNDGANSVSDVIALESPAGIFLNSPNIYQGTGSKIWHEGNDGSGSGLDADLWDGKQFSDYLNQGVKTTDNVTYNNISFNGNIISTSNYSNIIQIGSGGAENIVLKMRSTGVEGWIHWDDTTDRFRFKTNSNTFAPIEASNGYFNGLIQTNNLLRFDSTATTNNQNLGIYWSAFDKEGTGDYSDYASIRQTTNTGGLSGSVLEIKQENDSNDGVIVTTNSNTGFKHNGYIIWTDGNDGSGSGLDADKLDGKDSSHFVQTNTYKSLGIHKFTNSTTTDKFVAELTSIGAFNSYHTVVKSTWDYAGNNDLVTGHSTIGTFELAGSVIECWTDNNSTSSRGNIHIRVTRPNTGNGSGGVYVYNDQGSNYSPGWREIWTSSTDGSGSGLDADKLDGLNSSEFVRVNDDKYVNRTSNVIFDAGTSTTIKIQSNDNGVSKLLVVGDSQGTGAVEVGQSTLYGGGICYNGDSSPKYANDEASDYIGFYRNSRGVKYTVFDCFVNNDIIRFRDTPIIKYNNSYKKVIHEGTLSSNLKTINGQSIVGSGDIKVSTTGSSFGSIKTIGVYVHGTGSSQKTQTMDTFNTSSYINHPLSWLYTVGVATDHTYSITNISSPKFELLEAGKFDISASHYDLSDSRVNTDVLFYDKNGVYLGKFVYKKNSNTWSTGDYGTAAFYNASNNLIYDIPTNYFSGYRYGNGALYASVDLSVSDKIIFHPNTNKSSTHYFSVKREFSVKHPFSKVKQLVVKPVEYRAGYYRSSPSFVISNVFGGLHKINR